MYEYQDSTKESNYQKRNATLSIQRFSYDERTDDITWLQKTKYGETEMSLCFLEYFFDHYCFTASIEWVGRSISDYEITDSHYEIKLDSEGNIDFTWNYNINEYPEDAVITTLGELVQMWKDWGYYHKGEQ